MLAYELLVAAPSGKRARLQFGEEAEGAPPELQSTLPWFQCLPWF